ncbi:MAG: tetratricopeptide repeat protein, partial [Terriglobales bacterium]
MLWTVSKPMRLDFVAAISVLFVAIWAAAQTPQSATDVSPYFQSALAFEHRGEIDKAIEDYEKAITATPNHADSHYNLARLLAAKRNYDEAIRQYREAIRINPNDPDVHSNLGLALKNKGDLDSAEGEYRAALRLDSKHADA